MTVQPDMDDLNQARITARVAEWARAGRELYKLHAHGVTSVNPGDVISRAERLDHDCKETP